jgi:hypothetical protein
MSNLTRKFLALALIDQMGVVNGEARNLGMEKLKAAAQGILADARNGGFSPLLSRFESVSRIEPTLGSETVRNALKRAIAESTLILKQGLTESAERVN